MVIELEIEIVENFSTTDFSMMNPAKYCFYSTASSFSMRAMIYPFALIRTRLQNQDTKPLIKTVNGMQTAAASKSDIKISNSEFQSKTPVFQGYNGMFDAFKKILRQQGPRGLYDGFCVSSIAIVQPVVYIWTFEYTREYAERKLVKLGLFSSTTSYYNKVILAPMFGASVASLSASLFSVPIEIVSQFLQDAKSDGSKSTNIQLLHKVRELGPHQQRSLFVVRELWKTGKLFAFYKGFTVTCFQSVAYGVVFWSSYYYFNNLFFKWLDNRGTWIDHCIHGISGIIAGAFGCLTSNPIDLIRNQTQMHQTKPLETTKRLWREEGLKRMFVKGLPPRLITNALFGVIGLPLYEYVKKISRKDEFLNS